jgi:hypothetical protein
MIAERFNARTTKNSFPLLSTGDETSPSPKELYLHGTNYLFLVDEDVTTPCQPLSSQCVVGEGAMLPTFAVRLQGDETVHYRNLSDLMFRTWTELGVATVLPSQPKKNHKAIALLKSWLDADELEDKEHQETFEFLVKALDEDRSSSRKLFP